MGGDTQVNTIYVKNLATTVSKLTTLASPENDEYIQTLR